MGEHRGGVSATNYVLHFAPDDGPRTLCGRPRERVNVYVELEKKPPEPNDGTFCVMCQNKYHREVKHGS